MKKKFVRKEFFVCVFASFIIAWSMVLMTLAGKGSDPMTMLVEGFSRSCHVSMGTASILINVVYLILGSIFAREKLGFGTFCTVFITGVFIDFIQNYTAIELSDLICVITALPLYALGISLMINANAGMGAYEAFLINLSNRTNVEYSTIKIVSDCMFFLVALLLKGSYGYGTIVFCFLTGPLVGLFNHLFKKIIKGGMYA